MTRFYVLIVLGAFLFWGTFVYQLLQRIPDGETSGLVRKELTMPSLDELSRWMAHQPPLPDHLRDPFRAWSEKPVSKPRVIEAPKVVAMPHPLITVDAILPGETSVAILRYQGETVVAGVGQEIWGVTVLEIVGDSIRLHDQGGDFVLRK